jgi:Integrase core domain
VVSIRLSAMRLRRPHQWGACWMATLLWDQLRLDEFWLAALPPSREGTSWLNILKTLAGYQLISPGSEWRLHRHWFEHSAMGNPERYEYELYLAIEDIDHTRTKAKSPQTNGICERFHKTVLNEFYRVAFRKKVYHSIDELQADLDVWILEYNEQRPHQGRWCFGKTPMQTFLDAMPMTKEKMIAA